MLASMNEGMKGVYMRKWSARCKSLDLYGVRVSPLSRYRCMVFSCFCQDHDGFQSFYEVEFCSSDVLVNSVLVRPRGIHSVCYFVISVSHLLSTL